MKLRLLLSFVFSLLFMGAHAEFARRSFDNNMRYRGAYVVDYDESLTYTLYTDDGVMLSGADVYGLTDGLYNANPFTISLTDCFEFEMEKENFYWDNPKYDIFFAFSAGFINDTFKVVSHKREYESWVAEDGDIWLYTNCFRLTNQEGEIISENYTYGPIYVQGDHNILQCFDGDTMNIHHLSTAYDFRMISPDTLRYGQDFSLFGRVNGPNGDYGYTSLDLDMQCEGESSYYNPIMNIDYGNGDINGKDFILPATNFALGKNHLRANLYTVVETKDFVQKGHLEILDTVIYVECGLPELPPLKMLVDKDTLCYNDRVVLTVDNWYDMKYPAHFGQTQYRLYGDKETDAFVYDSTHTLRNFNPGRNRITVVRTDVCQRMSIDTVELTVIPELPQIDIDYTKDLCMGDTLVMTLNNLDQFRDYEKAYNANIRFDKIDAVSGYKRPVFTKHNTEKMLTSDPYFIFLEVSDDRCQANVQEFELNWQNCDQECVKDTVHIKPVSVDVVQNGVCDFSLVYTLKDSEGCSTYYYVDLNMEDCSGVESGTLDLLVQNNYVYLNEETKVSVFSIDGRKVFDGVCDNIKLPSGIYIFTTANAYRKVIIK